MKERILQLRKEGKTYNEIREIVGCSKGTISYHCGEGQREKYRKRLRKNRKTANSIIRRKMERFMRYKIKNFKRGTYGEPTNSRFDYATGYKRISEYPYCYITGRKIDLEIGRSYHLDHIIPHSKNGKNTLDNMGLTCREANVAKGDLMIEEFIQLCVEVCKHNNYEVIKKKNGAVGVSG